MKRKWQSCVAALAGVALACDSTDLAVPSEPEGPLQITRVTLLASGDGVRREAAVFSDTSAPATCAAGEPCAGTPFRDLHGARLAPPNPDSAGQLRVVLDRTPVYAGERELETPIYPAPAGSPDGMDTSLPPIDVVLNVPDVVTLESPDGCAAPPLTPQVSVSGSGQTPNPIDIPYGPALQLALAEGDPLAALEPGCRYQVRVHPGLTGRDRRPVDLAAAARLLTFQVEAPRVLRAGIGDDSADAWYPAAPAVDDPQTPAVAPPTSFQIASLPSNGVVRLRANAPLDTASVEALAVQATVDGVVVPALATLSLVVRDPETMAPRCDRGDARSIYVYPRGGSWGARPGARLALALDGARIFAVTQGPGHPAGKRSLGATLRVDATLSGQPADLRYTGVRASDVAQRGDAACQPTADMAAPQG